MDESEINDIRKITEFKGTSFSNFQKNKVKKELLNSLYNSKIEPANYWSAELICSGNFSDLWDIIILYISKYIHLGNPKLPIYLEMRFQNFKEILCNGYLDNELAMRNNDKIRKLFGELICVLCNSSKKHGFESIKIKTKDEFDITHMTSKLKAPNVSYAQHIFLKDDPKELFIAINEFAYHISSESKNTVSACYWVEWVMQFESICKSRKEKCAAERRDFAPVSPIFQTDVVWIIWDAILCESRGKNNDLLIKIQNAILAIFSIKYTPGCKRKRKYLIYFAISLLTETPNFKVAIIQNTSEIEAITKKINVIYKQIKKNEKAPATSYLFTNMTPQKSNLEKTIEKIDKMNSIM
jgi:hypothetical protein